MLAWLPFRSETLAQTFTLLGKLINPGSYLRLSFRENFYLIVFLIMAGMLASYALKQARHPIVSNPIVLRVSEAAALSLMIYFDFIFLKPVNQFIYFQF
jgi:hypothetical protein